MLDYVDVGLSIEGVLTTDENKQQEKGLTYLKKFFIKSQVKDGALEAINKLRSEGAKIHILAKSVSDEENKISNKINRFVTEQWLKFNHIEYDDITFYSDDKFAVVKDKKLDVMIEKSNEDINELSKITKVLYLNNEQDEQLNTKNVSKVNNFEEIYQEVTKIKNDLIKAIKDPIKPLSGYPSIDKPWDTKRTIQQTKFEIPGKTLYQQLYDANKDNLDKVAIIYLGKKITFRKFFKEIDKAARAYLEYGIKEDDAVTICMPNTPEGLYAFYAVNKIEAISNMIHPLSSESEEEIKDYLNEVASKLLISIDICYDKLKNILDETSVEQTVIVSAKDSMPFLTKIAFSLLQKYKDYSKLINFAINNQKETNNEKLIVNEKKYLDLKEKIKNSKKLKLELKEGKEYIKWNSFVKSGYNYVNDITCQYIKDKVAVLLHTGGTTGKSKAVKLSNENFNASAEQLKSTIPSYEPGDSLLAITPIFHGFGLGNCVHTPLCSNISVNLLPQYDNRLFTNAILKDKPNLILGVPTLWDAMIKNKKFIGKDLSFLKVLISGGDNLPAALENKMNDFLKEHNCPNKIFKGLGMTEALAAISFTQLNANPLSSVGIPLPGNNFKITVPGTDQEIIDGTIGEICEVGPTVMLGYLNNEEETNETIKTHKDGKKWLHSGDLGYMDQEGVIFYLQRLKRMIVSSGYNLYPSQIEEVIGQHEAVSNCVVVGSPHEYKVNVAKAYILLKDNYKLDSKLKEEIGSLCQKKLSKFSIPHDYEFVTELPKTKLGKVDYLKLEEENIKEYYAKQQKKESIMAEHHANQSEVKIKQLSLNNRNI